MPNRSPSPRFPLPGSPGSSWAIYKSRFANIFAGAEPSVLAAFWLFGLINNVLYVIILSAAQDLVGPTVPKGVVLLADVLPSFFTKLFAPYFIHKIPYWVRIISFCILSSAGMLLIALTPSTSSVSVKLFGVILASLSAGAGELSFLGLTHYYGQFSLAAWGSGTGGAGLFGSGLYYILTSAIGLSSKSTLLASAYLPIIMLISFFIVLPRGPLRRASQNYTNIPQADLEPAGLSNDDPDYLSPEPPVSHSTPSRSLFLTQLLRAQSLFIPYMLPLLLVYIAEYTINQGVAPTLLFPIRSSPFRSYRDFYPCYAALYQLGVFISRSSTPFIRIEHLYPPSFLQIANLILLVAHALFDFIPSVYIIFLIVFWEGLLGGAVYVNTFAEIHTAIPAAEREFSLAATSVSDSAGICIAGFIGMMIEPRLCAYQVEHGRDYCLRA